MSITFNDFMLVNKSFAEGFGVTLQIFFFTLLLAIPLGLIISFGSMSRFKIIRFPIKTFIWIIRGTPLMLQLLIVYYGPSLMFHMDSLDKFSSVIVTFVINYACYFSEIYRAGIEAVPKGQYEACQVLGMTKTQTFFKVILLQVVKNIAPPMSNEIMTLVKDTSLARIITLNEIIWAGYRFISSNGWIWPLFYTAVFYLLFCGLLTILFGRIEKKLSYFS